MNAPLEIGPTLVFPLSEDWSPAGPRDRIVVIETTAEEKALARAARSVFDPSRPQLSDAEVDAWAEALLRP